MKNCGFELFLKHKYFIPSATWEVHNWCERYPLKKEVATHSSILAWRIPWTEKTDQVQFMGSQRIRHGRVTPACQCRK